MPWMKLPPSKGKGDMKQGRRSLFSRNRIIFFACAIGLFLVDRITKEVLNSSFQPGDVIAPNVLGLFQFNMVHNTGAAWGMFADGTVALIVISFVVCIIVAFYARFLASDDSILDMVSLGLVLAGGLGNLYDRAMYGYVVDFITPTFVTFPTFNVADIGVTVGIALFIVSLIVSLKREFLREPSASASANRAEVSGSADTKEG